TRQIIPSQHGKVGGVHIWPDAIAFSPFSRNHPMSTNNRSVNRRRFFGLGISTAGVGALGLLTESAKPQGAKAALMKVGCQRGPTSDEMLQYWAQFGVKNICGYVQATGPDGAWEVAEIEKLKKRVESFGIALDMLALPLPSSYITKAPNPN